MAKQNLKLIIFICLVISTAIVFLVFRQKEETKIAAIPSFVSQVHASSETKIVSPDGKFTLVLKTKETGEARTYVVIRIDEKDGSSKEVLTKTVNTNTKITLPFNAFSPDNKYVFLKEDALGQTRYFVLTQSGELDFSSIFRAKYTNYVITEATGWAAPTLIVVNTDKSDGGKGPSFWFDVATKSFIQLSSRFD